MDIDHMSQFQTFSYDPMRFPKDQLSHLLKESSKKITKFKFYDNQQLFKSLSEVNFNK